MKAIIVEDQKFHKPNNPRWFERQIKWGDTTAPTPGPGEVRLDVFAAGVNNADRLQLEGLYPPPKGKSTIPGLEAAGIVEAVGQGVGGWKRGDRVCALLAGGGYAEQVTCVAEHLLPIPAGMSFEEAAALPEALATAFANVFSRVETRGSAANPGEVVLIHAGASGVGTAAIQLCRARGNPCFVTARSDDKLSRCRELGADDGCNPNDGQSFAEMVTKASGGRGADVILDCVGGAYFEENLSALAPGGRLVIIGNLSGVGASISARTFYLLFVQRKVVIGSVLRGRTDSEKSAVIEELRHEVWPEVENSKIRPVIDRVLPITDITHALRHIEDNKAQGKVILRIPR